MTAADLLRDMYSIGTRLESKKKKLAELEADKTANGGIRYDKERVVTSPPQEGGFENKVIRLAMLCDEYQADIERLTKLYNKARNIIESVPSPIDRAILDMLYADHHTIKEIAESLHYTDANIYYRKKKAMAYLKTIIL